MPLSAERTRARHLALATAALSCGGFAIGTTEFVTMGLLPGIAHGVHVSIPGAGHLISAYALGVVVGAPLIAVLAARLPRRGLLLGLMGWFALANAASALAPGYGSLVVTRFLADVPHGAFFGVASLVAASLVAPSRRGRAVSLVMLGLPIANVVGVPAATWMGQHLAWRTAYWAVAALGSVMVVNLQLRLMHVAGQAQTLGAAMNHTALNAANALGAWLGGLVIAAGLGYTAPSWVGVALSLGGLAVLGCSIALQRRTLADPA